MFWYLCSYWHTQLISIYIFQKKELLPVYNLAISGIRIKLTTLLLKNHTFSYYHLGLFRFFPPPSPTDKIIISPPLADMLS